MSNYVNRAWVETRIPRATLVEALDDDGDGGEDAGVFDLLAESVSNDVDNAIGSDATVAVALRTSAANVFLCELLYKRRGIADSANPWANEATRLRKRFENIGKGEERVEPLPAPAGGTTRIITEPAKSFPSGGRLIA